MGLFPKVALIHNRVSEVVTADLSPFESAKADHEISLAKKLNIVPHRRIKNRLGEN